MPSAQYITQVSGLPSGQAANLTVNARITSGAKPINDSSATVGPIYEDDVPGTYWCLLTYPNADVNLPVIGVALWSLSGAAVTVDPFPIPLFPDTVTVTANNDKTGYALSVTGLDSILIEPSVNLPQSLAIIGAATAGVSTINGTTITYAALNVSGTNRIVATAINGVRSNVILTLPPI